MKTKILNLVILSCLLIFSCAREENDTIVSNDKLYDQYLEKLIEEGSFVEIKNALYEQSIKQLIHIKNNSRTSDKFKNRSYSKASNEIEYICFFSDGSALAHFENGDTVLYDASNGSYMLLDNEVQGLIMCEKFATLTHTYY